MKTDGRKKPKFSLDSIVIDCPDAQSLADFYAKLLDWKRCPGGEEWAAVSNPEGTFLIYFQAEPDYVPPVWPASSGSQQQMAHLDFAVDDLEAAIEHALACGAQVPQTQYLENVKVCLDPAGHPFCLCKH